MNALIDLHLHTTASDGRLTPPELIKLLADSGLKYVAITDHDSTEGVASAIDAATLYPGLTIIPGIELSADPPQGEAHILGYFLDLGDSEFQSVLAEFRAGRESRGREMVDKLATLGVPIEWDRVEELAKGGAITRPHIALAMVERGHVATFQEAFEKYIGQTGLAYIQREKIAPETAIELIANHGGLPVLAHPARYVSDLEGLLPSIRKAGLVGLEVYYKDYTEAEQAELLKLCGQYDLIPCGGSDYHALKTPEEVDPGLVGPPLESLLRLRDMAGDRGRAILGDLNG